MKPEKLGEMMEKIIRDISRRNGTVQVMNKTALIIGFLALIGIIITGCSSGGSDGTGGVSTGTGIIDNASSSTLEGVFVDSPVEGLDYMTETHTGITDENGRFICFEGEMITFMIVKKHILTGLWINYNILRI